ncbi:MAG: HisA/HisF-related TIM barrel protein [Maricaulis sp.]|jgi:phosphoribosylformimino-5-aminoimidazole carboxamide ribotide isomerase|uniref:HisA/HisF-related TIM barrel protein n=1 Tax=Maricaulis sp. TaxID=1486257 RepID=UPI00262024C7|nr:HisA/HisF-related TIM barrel protein [Maricaulis sp.]MDM7983072.1 HisA/HisF-related TIM barrel protein [Maricaulis sp.]
MILYPAIDLLEDRVVRLMHGKFDAVTEYASDPVEVARQLRDAGAEWIHVVDLAGARDGARRQAGVIAEIAALGLNIQSGGGVRSSADIEAFLDAGVSRVVIGSLAISAPEQVLPWVDRFGPDRLTLAFDVQYVGGAYRPAVKGWTDVLTVTLDDVIQAYAGVELAHALVTDIGRDGDLSGPNLELYRYLVETYPSVGWQASGGVSSLEDLRAAQATGAAGAITGRAIYEGKFSVEEALACLQDA